MKRFFKHLAIFGLVLVLGACSQGRKSLSAGLNDDRMTDAVVLNRVLDDGMIFDHYGVFQLQLNIDQNFAWVDVLQMADGWNRSITYRILARRYNDAEFWVLAEGLSAAPGQTVEIDAIAGHKIYHYTEWAIEFEYMEYGVQFMPGAKNSRIVQDTINWPELDYLP